MIIIIIIIIVIIINIVLAAPMLMRGIYMVLLVSAAPEGQLAISS